jgi:hypothetical protein
VRTGPDKPQSDVFVSVQSVTHPRQAEFLNLELETCLRSANLAVEMYKTGDMVSADRTRTVAEECYSDVLRLMSDPKDSKPLTIKATQQFMAKLKELRKTLDALDQFRAREESRFRAEREIATSNGMVRKAAS